MLTYKTFSLSLQFKEKVAAKNFPQVKKIQLMEDIACEFNVAWNPVSFNPKNAGASGRVSDSIPSNLIYYKMFNFFMTERVFV